MEVRLPPGCLDESKAAAWESELAVTREERVASGPWRVTAQGTGVFLSREKAESGSVELWLSRKPEKVV